MLGLRCFRPRVRWRRRPRARARRRLRHNARRARCGSIHPRRVHARPNALRCPRLAARAIPETCAPLRPRWHDEPRACATEAASRTPTRQSSLAAPRTRRRIGSCALFAWAERPKKISARPAAIAATRTLSCHCFETNRALRPVYRGRSRANTYHDGDDRQRVSRRRDVRGSSSPSTARANHATRGSEFVACERVRTE